VAGQDGLMRLLPRSGDGVRPLPRSAVPAGRRRSRTASARADWLPPVRPATVLVEPHLLSVVADSTAAAGGLETGGPLIGTVQQSWPSDSTPASLIVSLLATVPPGPALRGGPSSVALGMSVDGERAASAVRWWRAVTGLDLLHLGDWHKHESSCPEPSAGDRRTAEAMRARTIAPVWLTAIAVVEQREREEIGAEDNRVHAIRSSGARHHVRFYRATPGPRLLRCAVRVGEQVLPRLPALPWHVADPARFGAECRLLAACGFDVAIKAPGSQARPGLTLRLRRDEGCEFTVITGPSYPFEPPLFRDGNGRRVRMDGAWSADRFLVDLVPKDR
jgi:hypothetical protein